MIVALAAAAVLAGVVAVVAQRWTLTLVAVGLTLAAAVAAAGIDRTATGDGIYAMAFVAGMVLVAAAADRSGLLAWLAARLAATVRSPSGLLLATFLAAVAVTTVLNLDTTAVLFTPLAVRIAIEADEPVAPFAIASVLGANFGSMLLPTSNLTNLVLWRGSGRSFAGFAAALAPVAAVAAVVTAAGLLLASRMWRPARLRAAAAAATRRTDAASDHEVSGAVDRVARLTDRPLAVASAAAIVGLTVGFVAGLPVAPAALAVGLGLALARRQLWAARLRTRLIVAVVALFTAAGVLREHLDVATRLHGISPLGLAALGAAIANVGSNLAAVLVLAPAAPGVPLTRALLIGVNLGVGFTPIASLATILWADALRQRGLPVPWRAYLVVAIPLSVLFVLLTPLLA